MFIPDPDFFLSRIPERISDLRTTTKNKGKTISCPTFFCSHKFNKIVNYLIFLNMYKESSDKEFQC